MPTTVTLSADLVAELDERAAERGITVEELICEFVRGSDRRLALEAFIGGAEGPDGSSLDIRRARAELGDRLSSEHDEWSADFAQPRPADDGRADRPA